MSEHVDQGSAQVAAAAAELRVLIGKLRRRMRESGSPGDFTPSQVAVLLRLEREGPASVTDLANAEGVRPQSMGATVAVLDSAGWVRGTADPRDGRRTILSLTDEAREQMAAGRAAREDWLFRSINAHLDAEELDQLEVGLKLLRRLADS